MGARTSGREAALQMLFALEASEDSAERVIQGFWRNFEGHPESREYAEECVRGVSGSLEKIDERLRSASINWRLERMTRVDRNILRLGAWELSNQRDIPRAVILDEAVELAKRFGSEDSSSFVNGVLDRVAELIGRGLAHERGEEPERSLTRSHGTEVHRARFAPAGRVAGGGVVRVRVRG